MVLVFSTFAVGWVGCAAYVKLVAQPMCRLVAQPMSWSENWRVILISALNEVVVEVEAELGNSFSLNI